MANGEHEGRTLGACSDCRYYWQEYLAGHVDEEELDARRAAWRSPGTTERGYVRLYQEHVLQADEGCDLDFLRGS
jgi:dihydroxyacid dehydratase/phosphogluconate dehydratase